VEVVAEAMGAEGDHNYSPLLLAVATLIGLPPSAPDDSSPSIFSAASLQSAGVGEFADLKYELILLYNAPALGKVALEAIFGLTLQYTARAFHDDAATISAENRADHFQHTFEGDALCLMALGGADGAPVAFCAHANFMVVPNAAATSASQPILYLSGVACDPRHQGRGIPSTILETTVPRLCNKFAAGYFALRTMNIGVMKMMRRVAPGRVFPLDLADSDGGKWVQPIAAAARALKTRFQWPLEPRAGGTVAEPLVMPCAYPPFLVPVFIGRPREREGSPAGGSGADELAVRVQSLMNRERGDAMLCIAPLL
jgi:hypothetical protein